MLKLPIAGQTFSKIRKNNFLSRPRRFGKSMLLDTLRELLKGKRDLFKDLWIDQSDYDFKPYPVIMLSMAGRGKGEEKLERGIVNRLNIQAKNNGLAPFDSFSPGYLLEMMVDNLHERTKERVAILVDEYDAPIQDVLNDLNLAEIHR